MSDTRWIASASAYASRVGDDLALLCQETSTYYTMNKTGAFVWSLLQKHASQAEIFQAMHEKYDVDLAQCEQDVSAIFTALKAAKLIEAV